MAYIGKTPVLGNFVKLDSITVVNGQAAYTMQNGGVNFTSYDNVNQFLVSLNGVLQAPTDSFTVSGSTLTFASNLSTGDVIDFVLVLGNSLDIGTPSDNTVTTAKLADSSVTAAKITDATITAAKLASGTVQNQSAFKNIIINGDMSIAQRGTSVSSITTSSYNTLDRFKLTIGSAGTWTQSQSTDVPSGQGFAKSLKMDCTTANASLSSGAYFFLEQQIEGQILQYLKKGTANAESLTLSFWVKSNKTGTYIAELRDTDNDRTISKSYTISSASTWEKKTITYDGDTSGAFTNDNNTSLRLEFHLGAGSSYQSGTLQTSWGARTQADEVVGQVNLADSTANEWYITGVQLEAGTSASDFEFLPYDVNLQRCFRYCQKHTDPHLVGVNSSSNLPSRVGMTLPVILRTTPSTSISGTFGFWDGGATANYTTVSTFFNNANSIQMDFSGSTFSVAGKTNIQYLSSGSNYILIDSEL